ncbi:cytochrome P450 family protein [Sphingobacterium faecale]|uniref:Uncharacterized protein n=1 Tax=Sphingobacterium faecale TaxID=2803775 RepID=A0ABS1R4E0_9SPHI|nr:hypothetical protein [Sphingobacterium faecale]MBL1409572.1 hypothetical protein [Sphingobacterium faecale]
MENTEQDYIIYRGTANKEYDYELLCKYHVLTEQLEKKLIPDSHPNYNQLKKLNVPNERIRIAKYSFFAFQDCNSQELIKVIDCSRFDSKGLVLYNTLHCIIQKFIENEYKMFYIRVENYLDTSDAEASRNDLALAGFAYDNLKELRNLLLMRESDLNNVGIVLDLRDTDGKKQKDYQVSIRDNTDKLNLINKQIDEIMSIVHYFGSEYLPSYRFAGIKNSELTSAFVSDIFEYVRPIIERSGKQSSAKRVFKGLVVKVIQDFVKKEGMRYTDGEIDEREQRLIAYDLLMENGLIDIELIKSHKNRDARIKYMESMPPYTDDYRSVIVSDFKQ